MATGTLAKPGSKYGPCKKQCEHIDCGATRAMATSACDRCHRAINYDTRYYIKEGTAIVHALCEEEAVEKTQ